MEQPNVDHQRFGVAREREPLKKRARRFVRAKIEKKEGNGEQGHPLHEIVMRFLDEPFWPEKLRPMKTYSRQHDDTDGSKEGWLNVIISNDGDAWISVDPRTTTLRFRTWDGGRRSVRVRNALLILAEAIRLENEKEESV